MTTDKLEAPTTFRIRWCPVCGRDDRINTFKSQHYSRGEKCEGEPITLEYSQAAVIAPQSLEGAQSENIHEEPHPGYDCGGTCVVHKFASPVAVTVDAETARDRKWVYSKDVMDALLVTFDSLKGRMPVSEVAFAVYRGLAAVPEFATAAPSDSSIQAAAAEIVKAWLWHTPEHDQERARVNIAAILSKRLGSAAVGEQDSLPMVVVRKAAQEPCRSYAKGCAANQPEESFWCAPCTARHLLAATPTSTQT